MIKRLTSVFFVCALLSFILVVPASAAVLDGTADWSGGYSSTAASGSFSLSNSVSGSVSYSSTNKNTQTLFESSKRSEDGYYALSRLNVPLTNVSTSVTVACSYYLTGGNSDKLGGSGADLTPVITWTDVQGNKQTGSDAYFTTFTPSVSYSSPGITLSGTYTGTEESPISNLFLDWDGSIAYGYADYRNGNSTVDVVFTSFRVISTSAPSAELSQLQDIAKGIAESNQILSAMYGDILAVCNSIYERTGDLLTAQNLTNQYFASIIPLLNNISSTTSNIYSLLSTQFSILISTIQSESDDIQAAINAAIDRMIAYLDGAFSSSVNPALPGTSEDINTGVDSWNQAESGYQSNASERFQSITADFSGFSGDVLSGIGLASTLFQRVWNALGSYVVLYTVPLTLSLCLLVVGRVSRSHSRGGGSSKSKDDGGET